MSAQTLMPSVATIIETPCIETPCHRVGVVHPTRRLCSGCGRSLDETARWIELSDAERPRIMAQLPSRVAALNSAAAAPTLAHEDD